MTLNELTGLAVSPSFVTAIISFLFGLIAKTFRPFIPNERELENRITLQKDAIVERLTERTFRLLDTAINYKPLRATAAGEEDITRNYVAVQLRASECYWDLVNLANQIERIFSHFLYIAIGSLALGVLFIFLPSTQNLVLTICTLLIVYQIIMMIRLRHSHTIIRKYEQNPPIN